MKSKPERTPPAGTSLLLVDDNPSGLAARKMVLAELGYEITTAPDAESAIELFRQSPFPLMVTDYKMPGKNGVELIQAIREIAPATRVVLISGFVDAMGMTEESSGADVVIMKSANEVLQLVRAVNRLSKRSAAKQPARAKSSLKLKKSSGS
ncbi:MAG: response regulator [Acidobacteriota bacterium]|jgi:CheY-like chemotaxis protein|nr:response regulator [Bryobacteraceae bacterium CoA2 C42]